LKKEISLVLSGGGARGLAYIGVIEELERKGYIIKSIAGTSIGALIGGVYAAGKLQEFKNWVTTLSKYDVFKLMDFTLNLGFIKMDRVFDEIKKIIGDCDFSCLSIKLKVVAADLSTTKEVIFDKGDLFDAIRASIAYPTIITPHYINNKMYDDGGIVNPMPLNIVQGENNTIVAVDLSSDIKYKTEQVNTDYSFIKKLIKSWRGSKKKKEQWSYIKLIDQSLSTMNKQLTRLSLKLYKPDILIKISVDSGGFFDYYNANELIEYGRKQTKKYVKN